MNEHPVFLAVWTRCYHKSPFLSLSIQSTVLWASWVGDTKRLGEWYIGLLEDIKETWTLLTALWTSWRSCPWADAGALPLDSPNSCWASPGLCVLCGQLLVHAPDGSESELWQRTSEPMQKIGLNLQVRERPQIWALALPLGNLSKISGWLFIRSCGN